MNQAWMRLQKLSEHHALQLWRAGQYGIGRYHGRSGQRAMYTVPEAIEENCKILGRGDEAEIKNRIFWYVTFHPNVFSATTAREA